MLTEWDYKKNNELGIDPARIGVGFRPKVWWVCPNGHSYDSVIFPRTHGVGCPYCSTPVRKILAGFNDLATTNPELLDEWDYEKNCIEPTEIGRGYTKDVWWKCKNGHSYQATVINHGKESCGCPYCSGRRATQENNLLTKFPALAKEWDYERNTVDPTTLSLGGKQKFWWKCEKGHRWEATVNTRTANGYVSSCPLCTKKLRISFPEKAIFFYIQRAFPDAIENYRPSWLGKKEIDIYIPSLKTGIEYDGARYHKASRDLQKDILCSKNGVTLIRIREKGADKIKSDSVVFELQDTYKISGEHLVPALHFLEKKLNVNLNINLTKDYDAIRNLVVSYDIENCLAKTNPEVLAEWDYEKNELIGNTPENVSAGAGIAVWWKCPKGHSYKAVMSNKINGGTGCPYCSGKKVLEGFNDVATVDPDLLSKWDFRKNTIRPTEVSIGSNKKVWLICKHGHSYQVSLLNYKKGGCPYCSGHKVLAGFNDLATTHPELLEEWDYEKNEIQPTEVSKGYEKKVWWKCNKGHSYFTSPNRKTSKNAKCPYCSGQRVLTGFNDIATTNPELLKEWDYERNTIKPTEISKGSGKKIWLKCNKGHSYETTIPSRIKGSSCSYCGHNKVLKGYNDVATTDPYVLKFWDDDHYSPYELSRKSTKTISWKYPSCKHTWEAKLYHFTAIKKCPGCKKNLIDC